MTAVLAPIYTDNQGVAYIQGTGIKVVEVVRVARSTGERADTIQGALPQLSTEQIYAALSYYYGHQAELDAELERRDRRVEELRAEADVHPFEARMRAAGRLP